jgi:hypothetical protein
MNRPALNAPQSDLNKYIDHLLWKIEHKDQQIMSLSRQCDAYVKTIKDHHQITQNLIDNVNSVLPELGLPGSSFEENKIMNCEILHKGATIEFDPNRPVSSVFMDEFSQKYMGTWYRNNGQLTAAKGYLKPLIESEFSTIVSNDQPTGYITITPEITAEDRPIDPDDIKDPPMYIVIIILVVYVMVCILIILIFRK